MLMAKYSASRNTGAQAAVRARLHSTIGGSSDTELNEFTVSPSRLPAGPSVVMRHTPVGKQPSALRKSRWSSSRRAGARTSSHMSGGLLHSLEVLALEVGRDLLHEAVHLLLHQRMRLVADVEVEDHLFDARLLDFLQRLDDLLRRAEEDRAIGEVLLLHVAQDLGDLDEVLHGRRRVLRLLRNRADHAMVEVVELALSAVVLALRIIGDEDEVAAHRPTGLVARSYASLAVAVDRLVQAAEHHARGEGRVDDVEAALCRHVDAGLGKRGDVEGQRLLHRLGRDRHLGDVVEPALVRPRSG